MSSQQDLDQVHAEIDNCFICQEQGVGLRKPTHIERGNISAKVVLIGIAPGQSASHHGQAFAGNSFTRLTSWFGDVGYRYDPVELREKLYMTSLNKCGANPDSPSNRGKLWSNCQRFLGRQLDIIRPSLVVLLGQESASRVLTAITCNPYAEVVGSVFQTEDVFDDLFPLTAINARWLLAPHPSGLSRILNDPEIRTRFLRSLGDELRNVRF